MNRQPDRASPLYPFLVVAALAGFTVVACSSNAATRFFTWPWVFYGELLLLIPVILLGFDAWLHPRSLLARGTAWALLAVAASIGLSAGLSLRPQFSFEASLFLWGGLALAALLVRQIDRFGPSGPPPFFLRGAGLCLAASVLSGLGLWLADLAPHFPLDDGPIGFLRWLRLQRNLHPAGHWNYTGGLALLALPWLATLAWRERGWWRTLWLVLVGGAALMLFSAASRGATLGGLAALTFASVILAHARGLRGRHLALLSAAVLLVGAVLVVANPRVRASLTHSSGAFVPTEGDVQRLAMMQGGALLLRERPWTGHGTGMTPFVYPAVRTRLIGGVETSFQLHNTPLQWAVDLGLIGVAAALLLGGVACTGTWRWWRRSASDPLRPYALASACTLVGYGVLAVTDYQLSVVAITAAVAFHLALLLAGNTTAATPSVAVPRTQRLVGPACLVAAAFAALVLGPQWHARYQFWSAWYATDPHDRVAVVRQLRAAADAAPWNPHYRTHLALRLAEQAGNSAERAAARDELARALALDPNQESCEAALGWLWLPDDPAQAARHFRAALALVPDRDTLHLGLAFAELAQQRREAAAHSLALECVVNPEFITSPLWQMEPLASLRPAVVAEADRLFARALGHQNLPTWRQPALRYARAFVRWWPDGPAPGGEALAGASEEQRRIFAALAAETTGAPPAAADLPPPLASLAAARAQPAAAFSLLTLPAANTEQARAGALARLGRSPETPLADLLRRPAPGGTGWFVQKIARGHFAIMQRNSDGPGYPDLCPRYHDAFVDAFVRVLFPPRGLLPGPVLTELRIPDGGSKRPDSTAAP